MRTVRPLIIAVITAVALSACGGASTPSSSTSSKPISIGFGMFVIGTPFAQDVVKGARDAGKDLGISVIIEGPQGFDPVALAQTDQDLAAGGADGVASPAPAGVGKVLRDIQTSGKAIATLNSLDPTLNTVYVGEASVNSGRILGKKIVDKLGGASATGKVLIGTCVPGLQVLENRVKGTKEGLAGAPGLQILGVFGTDTDVSKNYPIYEQQFARHPDATVILGMCSTDTVSIGKLNTANGMKFLGGGYDVTPETLKVVADGSVYVTMGQGAYLQGYLPVRMLVDALRNSKPVPTGFINSGSEPVTKDNVQTFQGFYEANGPNSIHTFYKQRETSDYTKDLQPLSAESA